MTKYNEMIFICTGGKTCLEDCKCKVPHRSYPIGGQPCSDPNQGSCWHNNHKDKKFHECTHELLPKAKV